MRPRLTVALRRSLTVWRRSLATVAPFYGSVSIHSDGKTPSSPSKCLADSFRRPDGRRILPDPGFVLILGLVLKTQWWSLFRAAAGSQTNSRAVFWGSKEFNAGCFEGLLNLQQRR
jgi:hypothetical protein